MTQQTTSGSRGLLQHEGLIFEFGSNDSTGVDLPEPKGRKSRLGGVTRAAKPALPGLSAFRSVLVQQQHSSRCRSQACGSGRAQLQGGAARD